MRIFSSTIFVAVCSLAFSLGSCQSPQQPAGGGTTSVSTNNGSDATTWFDGGVISSISSNTSAANLDIKDFLALGMRDIYYWRDRVPANLTGATFPTPDSVLSFTRVLPEDRFSAIVQDGIGYYNRIFNAQQPAIFGFATTYIAANKEARVNRVLVPSAAWQAGVRRGMKILAIDGKAVPNTFDAFAQIINGLGTTTTLDVEDSSGAKRTLSFMRTTFVEQVVPVTKVFTIGTKKVGYLLFTSFTQSAVNELSAAFADLKAQGVTELVLDLRYNGGGAITTAGHLCSLIASQLAGTPYALIKYNTRYTANNQQYTMTYQANSSNLQRLVVITTRSTASASELVINALKPYITVVTIGETSFGKPVGSNPVIHQKSGYMLLPISFAYTNALGQADFINGFAPTYKAADDVTRDFGDPQEASLKAALTYIEKGTLPVTAKTAAAIASDESARSVPMEGERVIPVFIPPAK
jgi:carboxyl-terminal processing protease